MNGRLIDIGVTAMAAILACAGVAAHAPVAITTVLGLILLASPGYLLSQLLLGSQLPGLERLAVSTGLAFFVPILGGLLLYAAGVPLYRSTWLCLLAGVTLVCDAMALLRRHANAETYPMIRRKGGASRASMLSPSPPPWSLPYAQ